MIRKLLLVGGGGHCRSVISALRAGDMEYEKIGIVDRREKAGQEIGGIAIVGEDDDLEQLYSQGYTDAFITLGSVGNPQKRKQLFRKIKEIGFHVPNIIDRSCVISDDARLGEGIFAGKGSVINSGAIVADGCIINTSATIEHDCEIDAFVHMATGSVLCGEVRIGADTHIGANATVIQGICIGKNVIIGAGSVIIRNVEDGVTIIGNPGRVIS
ncbi:MAG: acetyltransferase [Lachnospiraceae bacterium]|nr:acetyltransferase [Lachnospiraceae bacterium]MCI9341698.1 acetyltransferase [Lachnospiraceae bacterium]